MLSEYHISLDVMSDYIDEIYADIKQYGNIKLKMDSDTDSSKVDHYTKIYLSRPLNRLQPLTMTIGIKSLVDNINGRYFRDEDVVCFIWAMNHEFVHVKDHMKAYISKSASNDVKNAAKIDVIADCIPDFRYYSEVFFPSEIKAERDAFIATDIFFKEHETDINYKQIILNRINSDDYVFLKKKCSSYDDIYDYLHERYERSFYDLKLGMLWKYPVKSKVARDFIGSPEMTNKIIDNPTNGLEETEAAMVYIVKHYPRQLGAYKCLHKDYLPSKFRKFNKQFDRDLPDIDYDDEREQQDEKE